MTADRAPHHDEETLVAQLADPSARRRLRSLPGLDPALAERLLDYPEDFLTRQRDLSLANVVRIAPWSAVQAAATWLAAGQAAPALWQRLQAEPDTLVMLAQELAAGSDAAAAENTLQLLVLDPLDPFALGADRRAAIAEAGLRSPHAQARGLAAEYLSESHPARVLVLFDRLVVDSDQRLRAVAWRVAFAHARLAARERAFALLGDERAPLDVRRSALLAAGEYLPTDALVDLLSWFVAHPDPDLAGDAATLLHDMHRNPLIAEAALRSPHEHVRETAERLLDPLRGSPAAGGNRPGSPLSTAEIFEDLVRRIPERKP